MAYLLENHHQPFLSLTACEWNSFPMMSKMPLAVSFSALSYFTCNHMCSFTNAFFLFCLWTGESPGNRDGPNNLKKVKVSKASSSHDLLSGTCTFLVCCCATMCCLYIFAASSVFLLPPHAISTTSIAYFLVSHCTTKAVP